MLTGFPPATTLLFSGVGTLLFLVVTGNRLPSYLGSSFSVIAPGDRGGGLPRCWQRLGRAGGGRRAATAIALIVGIADFTWQVGTLTFTGIALGSIAALVVYHGMRALSTLRAARDWT